MDILCTYEKKKYIKTERNTSLSPYLLRVQIFKII